MSNSREESDLTVPGPEHWKHVPQDLLANLKFRRALLLRCAKDPEARRLHMQACSEDIIYFCLTTVWVYEPRPRYTKKGFELPKEIPMIPWEHQILRMRAIRYYLGRSDIGVEKSRAEGASWIGVIMAVHDLVCQEQMEKISIISKDMEAVDKSGDMDSIMEKVDFLLEKLPFWMTGEKHAVEGNKKDGWVRKLNSHVIKNLRTGSALGGYAATAHAGSGGRAKWIMQDELAKFPAEAAEAVMASTQHVTESRFFVSTPVGASGEFYNLMHSASSMIRINLNWEQNSTRNRGLYRFRNGVPEAVDPENNPLPEHYNPPTREVIRMFDDLRGRGFKLQTGVRSPWYDKECYRPQATPQNIAQELDRNYGGSSYKIFDSMFMKAALETVMNPLHFAKVKFEIEAIDPTYELSTNIPPPHLEMVDKGPMKLWVPLDSAGRPPRGRYAVGADVSTGMGGTFTSASTIFVVDCQSNEQVAEWADRHTIPGDFADVLIAVSMIFWNAFLNWEIDGPGGAVTRRILKRKYSNIYYRDEKNLARKTKAKKMAGWSTKSGKEAMFDDFMGAVKQKQLILRSQSLVNECGNYVRKKRQDLSRFDPQCGRRCL